MNGETDPIQPAEKKMRVNEGKVPMHGVQRSIYIDVEVSFYGVSAYLFIYLLVHNLFFLWYGEVGHCYYLDLCLYFYLYIYIFLFKSTTVSRNVCA